MTVVLEELKGAARGIAKRPAFSVLVVGVLAAGLAGVIFMLALINGLVIQPLPFPSPDQLLHAGVRGSGGDDINPVQTRDLIDVRRELASVAETAGYANSTMNLSDLGQPQRYSGAFASANLFHVLGVAPILGRDFSDADARDGAPAVAMLSYELWQSRYAGDRAIVGKQIRVNAEPATVVGVMPPKFSYPSREVIWIAGHVSDASKPDDLSWWLVLRRHADATNAAVDTAFGAWFTDASHAQPERFRSLRAGVEPLANMTVGSSTRLLLGIMLAAVLMVLLIACANAANLLLTRTLSRRQEFAVRIALGASHRRIVALLLSESVLLSLLATTIAFGVAHVGVNWLQAELAQSDTSPLWLRFSIDGAVIACAFGAAMLTALATGLLPALRAGATATADLRDSTRSVASGSFSRVSRILVIGEVALSCVLLISVGSLVRSIVALDHTDLGIDTHHLLTARVVLPTTAYATGADQDRLFERLGERLRSDADVVDATVGTVLPGTWYNDTRDVLPSATVPGDGPVPQAHYGAVDDHFLGAYGISLRQGRFFDRRDTASGVRVAVVDQRFVDRYSAGKPVLDRQFRLDPRDPKGATVTVIGVIGALALDVPGATTLPTLLVPLRQDPFRVASIAVRTRGEPLAFAPRLNATMREVDADTPLYWLRDYPEVMRSVTAQSRFLAKDFAILGIIALILAGAGLYGVMAFSVGQRTREIGVRRALGAPGSRVLRHLFMRSFVQLGIGLAIGLAAGLPFAHLLTRSTQSLAVGNSSVVLGALGVLILAAIAAVIVPARRALRVDPTVALRHE